MRTEGYTLLGITRLAVNRPLTIIMFVLALVIMGLVAYSRLQVSRFPKVEFPMVVVVVGFPGASAQETEHLVTEPVERALNGISGVKTITSSSQEGASIITVELNDNADVNQAASDIDRKLSSIRSGLPSDSLQPNIIKADVAAFPLMNVALSGDAPVSQLYDLAKDTLGPRLQAVPGVAQVSILGGRDAEVHILVDPVKLQTYGLSMEQVRTVLEQDNLSRPGGTIRQGDTQYNVRAISRFTSLGQFGDAIVAASSAGTVRLRDIARVEDTRAKETTILRFNGKASLGLSILQQSNANAVATAAVLRQELAKLESTLPPGVTFSITSDSAQFTQASISAVQRDLIIAVFVCGLVLLLFLHAWRNTVIVLLAIPTSMITTFLVMYFLHFTLDMISLLALALLVGILVDDSIVVLENIHRHRQLGEEPLLAALNGRSEIGAAALAITLTDVVVFLPMGFLSGVVGAFFKEYGITIVAATLMSLFISFTLTPMLAAHWLTPERVDTLNFKARRRIGIPFADIGLWLDARLDAWRGRYRRALHWSLRHRPTVLLGGFLSLVVAIAFLPLGLIGFEVVPSTDDGLFTLDAQMPSDSSLQATSGAMYTFEQKLLKLSEVRYVFSTVGAGGAGGGFLGPSNGAVGTMSVQLVDKSERKRSSLEVLAEARRLGNTIEGLTVTGQVQTGFGAGPAVKIRVEGEDDATLALLSAQLMDVIRSVPNITDVRLQQQAAAPEIQARIDRSRASPLGISAAGVASALRTAVNGVTVGRYDRGNGTESNVILRLDGGDTSSPAELSGLPVYAPVAGRTVRLDQVAMIQAANSPTQISRANLRRQVTVLADITAGSPGTIGSAIQAKATAISMPPGYRFNFTSQQDQGEVFGQLFLAVGLSIALMYMLLVALYQSFVQPLAIMFSLPLALVGAFIGLAVSHNTFNLFSMLGMILLMALVAKNGILLVDYINVLREEGFERAEAIAEAGATRLRPILMTSATIVFSMVPLALKLEAGGETRAPIAVVLMGGVISSTLLTLLVVPTAYTVLEDIPSWMRRAIAAPVSLVRGRKPEPAHIKGD